MSVEDALSLVVPLSLTGVLALLVLYVMFEPDKAGVLASHLWRALGRVWKGADRKAVAYRVEGEINGGRHDLVKHGPAEILDGKLKLRWRDVDQARAVAESGDVVVFMRKSEHHAENVAHALMAYLPKALVPRARRYVSPDTMKAADLTVARAVLSRDEVTRGALDVFYEKHLDPASSRDEAMQQSLEVMDDIDLHGWLIRVLLPEFRLLGNRLHPGRCDDPCLAEGDKFARWLGELAGKGKGESVASLVFKGRYYRVAIIFVALREVLAEKGTHPYRQRAKRHLYKDRFDAVYLIARDPNLWAVEELVADLRSDGLVAEVTAHRFHLRPDFAARKGFERKHSIVACLRRKRMLGEDEAVDPETGEFTALPEDIFDPNEQTVPAEGAAP